MDKVEKETRDSLSHVLEMFGDRQIFIAYEMLLEEAMKRHQCLKCGYRFHLSLASCPCETED